MNKRAFINGFIKAAMNTNMAPTGASNVPQPSAAPAGPAGAMPPPPAAMSQQGVAPLQVPAPQGNPAMQKFMQLMQQYQQQGGGQKPSPQAVQPVHIRN